MKNLTIAFCCNDPANGIGCGKATSIKIVEMDFEISTYCVNGGAVVRVEDRRHPRARKADGDFTLRVGRICLPAISYRTHYGNWCWDAAQISSVYALDVVNYFARNANWFCEEGPSLLFDRFNAHQMIDPTTWGEALRG